MMIFVCIRYWQRTWEETPSAQSLQLRSAVGSRTWTEAAVAEPLFEPPREPPNTVGTDTRLPLLAACFCLELQGDGLEAPELPGFPHQWSPVFKAVMRWRGQGVGASAADMGKHLQQTYAHRSHDQVRMETFLLCLIYHHYININSNQFWMFSIF